MIKRNSKKAKEKFKEVLGDSKNFITPEVIEYVKTDNYYIEISKGQDLNREVVYGVTVIDRAGDHRNHGLSKGNFKNYTECMEYIKEELA